MKKNHVLLVVLFLISSWSSFSQDYSNLWEGHYSYLNIKDVVSGSNKIYAAAENAVFSYDIETQEMTKISTINGLSGEFISTIHYSEAYELLLIGYENGLIEVYLEQEEDVVTVIDIIDKPTIPPSNKRINHFNEHDDLVYISTDFGISVYDLGRLEFGDTYYIGNGGSQIIINQTTVHDGYIYAACENNSGLRRALVDSDNLINFQEWSQLAVGNYTAVESVQEKLYAVRLDRNIYEYNGVNLIQLYQYTTPPLDVKESQGNLLIILSEEVFIYDQNFNIILNHNLDENFSTDFTSAVILEETIFIGTEDFGILGFNILMPSDYNEVHPDGPLRNNAFSIEAGFGSLWVAYGDYTISYFPSPIRKYGVSHLREEEWFNIPNDSLFEAQNLNAISINPFNPNQVFISSFNTGIVEIINDEPVTLFNQNNSGLESIVVPSAPNFISIRVTGTTFDDSGLLWSLTCRVDRPLKSYNPSTGQWQGYNFLEIIQDGLTGESGYSDIVIGADGTKWIGGERNGLYGFNENGNQLKNIFSEDPANLPSTQIKALAIDDRNQLWIGTNRGLRVLYNTSNFFTDENVRTEAIIILEDGIPRELLEQQYISDIKVDGSNNKWIGTIGAGVFYLSSDGQETIYHFTTDNSPLPSNNVNDIALDKDNGRVSIATDRGLLSFGAGGSKPKGDLESAYIYPNPVRPSFNINEEKVKIKDISENVNIKITDIEGNLVAEAQSNVNLRYRGYNLEIDGGTAYWNGKNLANNTVASGVYLVMLSDLDTLETNVLKVMVVR